MQKSANPGEMVSDVTTTDPGTTPTGTDLNGTDLNGTDLNGTDLNGTDLNGTDLNGTDLNGTDLNGTDLNGTDGVTTEGIDQETEDPQAKPPAPAGAPDVVVGYRGVTATAAAGITYRQLDYWARTGLVVPSVRDASGSGTQRLYSFRDIVVLKVVKRLLDAGVSLQNIRKAIETLRRWGEDDLATMTLISDGTTVYECRSAEEVVDLLQGGQGVFGIAIGGAFKEIQGSLAELPLAEASDEPPAPRESAPTMDELAARRARRRAG